MASSQTDRISGVNSSAAIKVPVRCATTAAITLAGLQTVDGQALAANDRVLVKNQVDQTTNGVYLAATGNWTRDADFDDNRDVTSGTIIPVYSGTSNGGLLYELTTASPISIGSSNLTFSIIGNPTVSAAMAPVVTASTLAAARAALGVSTGTVTSVNITDGTNGGLAFSGGPITASGTFSGSMAPSDLLTKASPATTDSVLLMDAAASNVAKTATIAHILALASISQPTLLQHQLASSTAGPAVTAGSWQQRVINTKVSDANSNVAAFASNQFTMVAGTYLFWAFTSVDASTGSVIKTRLRNTTGSTTLLVSNNDIFQGNAGASNPLVGVFTVAASQVLEIDQYVSAGSPISGAALTSGEVEVYLTVLLLRIA